MARAARLPWPMASVSVRAPATMSPPANTPGRAVIMSAPTGTTPPSTAISGVPSSSDRSASCPSASTTESAAQLLDLAGGLGEAVVVELHPLDREDLAGLTDDGREPLEPHALLDGVLHLVDVGRHAVPGAPVDDHGILGAEAPCRAGGVHGGVAAAVDHDPAAEHRRVVVLGLVQQRHRVEDAGRVAGGDVGVLAHAGPPRRGRRRRSPRPPSPAPGRRPCGRSTISTPMDAIRAISLATTSRGRR